MIRKGDVVVDTLNDGRIGTVQDILVDRLWLRRINGGREWDVHKAHVRKATEAEILSERNAARNRMTRSTPH
jgi:hypothetical protein